MRIFVSYSRIDRERAEAVARDLTAEGFDVFIDQTIDVGAQWHTEILEALEDAAAVVVLWSQASRTSNWVLSEALFAKDTGKLVPAQIEPCAIPVGFNILQTASLIDHVAGSRQGGEWLKLVAALRALAPEQPQDNVATNIAYWEAFNPVADRYAVQRKVRRKARSSSYLFGLERGDGFEAYSASWISRGHGGLLASYLWLWYTDPARVQLAMATCRELAPRISRVLGEDVKIRRQTDHGLWVFVQRAANPDDRQAWPEQHEWLAGRMLRFDTAYRAVVAPALEAAAV